MTTSPALAFTLTCAFYCVCNPSFADNHRPYPYEWIASQAEVIAIGEFVESKRVLPEDEQKDWSIFQSRVRVLHVFKGNPEIQSFVVVHRRWAKENALPLANPSFAKMPREMAAAFDALDIGQSVDVSKYHGFFLMFLRKRDDKFLPVTGPDWENYSIQRLSGHFDYERPKDEPANEGNRHKTAPNNPKEDGP